MKGDVYPAKENVFRAFRETPFDEVRVVCLLQDPYHDGSATGLALSNYDSKLIPSPSLRQVLLEVENSVYGGFSFDHPQSFELVHWAHQGVLLLNTALTVRKGEAGSHTKEWKFFTEAVLQALDDGHSGLVYMLWGSHAKAYKKFITDSKQIVLEASHPASVCYGKDGFTGCNHFNLANEYLMKANNIKINW
jgi:uracil-DNA glycosylase